MALTDIINKDIDELVKNLNTSEIYYINDTMLVIKLCKSKAFNKFLSDKNISPKFKNYHNDSNKSYRKIVYGNDVIIPEHFITMCMVKNTQNLVNLICCETYIESQKDTYFRNKDDTGFLLNGTFFFMSQHISNGYYGITDPGKVYKSISDYKYNKLTDGRNSPSFPNSDDAGTPSVMDPATNIGSMGGSIIKHTLKFAAEVCGVMTIDENSKINIIHYDEFNPIKTTLSPQSQCLFGHLLVKNSDIVMKEELFNIVYNLHALGIYNKSLPPLEPFTKCKLCKQDGTELTPTDVINLVLNEFIYLKNADNKIYKTLYSLQHIFTPYYMNLYKLENPRGFAGAILPAMPSHGSDLNPRTCIFRDANDNVFFVNVEGRNDYGGRGLDLFDLAILCKSLGAVDAINLDGGGSSVMEIKEKGYPHSEHIGLHNYLVGNIIKVSPK